MSFPGASSSKAVSRNKIFQSDDDRFTAQSSDAAEEDAMVTEDEGSDEEQSLNNAPQIEPLSAEALAEFEAKQASTGIIYISRIPPAMRPSKVRHLMGGFGAIGRVYLQQEGTLGRSHDIQCPLHHRML